MKAFFCAECGLETTKWAGRCPACGAWNSFKETDKLTSKKNKKQTESPQQPLLLTEVPDDNLQRLNTGIKELDSTLGGGITAGMAALIGGEPGVGKSTLLLQLADNLAKTGLKCVYVSGEESYGQIKQRASRMKIKAENLYLLCSMELENILKQLKTLEPNFIVIDSIQAVYTSLIDSSPGSITQLRECAGSFIRFAKQSNIPVFLIGHVTKDGYLAGPKIIEHMVDTVLYFEGELNNQYKILRTSKNRFGSTNEIGIFEMTAKGLLGVENPSGLFLNRDDNSPGCAVGSVLEGTRAFLVEVQALATLSGYGTPQRVALGFDHKRLSLLLAVIEKNLALQLRAHDVFLNMTGGIKVSDPSIDLAVISAVLSSFREKPVQANTCLIGEVGLNGEIRPSAQAEKRVKEAIKLGYERIIVSKQLKIKTGRIVPINHLGQLSDYLF